MLLPPDPLSQWHHATQQVVQGRDLGDILTSTFPPPLLQSKPPRLPSLLLHLSRTVPISPHHLSWSDCLLANLLQSHPFPSSSPHGRKNDFSKPQIYVIPLRKVLQVYLLASRYSPNSSKGPLALSPVSPKYTVLCSRAPHCPSSPHTPRP